MKLLIAVLFSLGSLTAFSADNESVSDLSYSSSAGFEYYHGSGVFKKPSGRSMNFLASLTIRKLGDGRFNFIYGIYLPHKNKHHEIVISEREGASYLDVMADGENVGYGYCMGNKCHFEYSVMGYSVEETMYRHKRSNSIVCMGSKSNEGGIVKSWKMSLKKVF